MNKSRVLDNAVDILDRHSGKIILGFLALTLILTIPLLMMDVDEDASSEPRGEIFAIRATAPTSHRIRKIERIQSKNSNARFRFSLRFGYRRFFPVEFGRFVPSYFRSPNEPDLGGPSAWTGRSCWRMGGTSNLVVAALVAALDDSRAGVRSYAVDALGELGAEANGAAPRFNGGLRWTASSHGSARNSS